MSASPAVLKNLPSKVDIDAERSKRSFSRFVQGAWPVVEQASPYRSNWHIDFIGTYLEALYKLEIQNLIINIPPGYAKSLLSSVLFPAWVWANNPAIRFFCGSHGVDLAIRDAVRSRRLIQSDWYQERWGDVYQMTTDQNVKSRYENNKTGQRVSVGVDGGWTGHRGNFIVWDDPLDKNQKDSATERKRANDAVKGSMGTRGDNPKEIRRILIMQRLHDDDPTGHLLAEMKGNADFPQFEHLVLPARYEPKRFFSSIGLEDPRKTPGELLFPQLFDETVVKQTEALLGPVDAAGQLQQRPAPAGGAIFLSDWWKEGKNRYDPADTSIYSKAIARWLFWDTAQKDAEQNDYTALVVFDLLPDYRVILRDVWWRKLLFPQLSSAIEQETARWMYDEKLRETVIEDKSSGISAIQTLEQGAETEISEKIKAFNPGSYSKSARMRQASLWCDRGCVLLPEPHESVPWLHDFEDMLYKLPAAKFDDPGDAFSMGILYLENILAQGWQARTRRMK